MTRVREEQPFAFARPAMALVAACALWGMSFPLMKTLNAAALSSAPGMNGWFVSALMVALRFVVAAIVLVVFRPVVPTRGELVQGILLGVVTGAGMLLQTDALTYIEASTSAFLTQGYVVLLPIVTFLMTGFAPPVRVVCCALLVLVGLGVLARFDPSTLSLGRGEVETLGAATCFTAQILLLDVPRFRDNRADPVTIAMFLSMGLLVSPVVLYTARSPEDFVAALAPRGALAMLAVIVVFPTVGSFGLMNRFQKYVTPAEAGIIYACEPVFASALALFLPAFLSRWSNVDYANEKLEARLLVGGALVVAANVLLSLSSRPRTTAP
jgi:drug/metabolite transporter (DMT)-like permease